MPVRKIEEQNQVAFVGWFRVQYPKYKDLITIPSFGENIGAHRMRRLKQMGLTPGWPDLFIAVPRDFQMWSSFGLFIEMKVPGEYPTKHQVNIHNQLSEQGYCVEVCWSWDEARETVQDYLK